MHQSTKNKSRRSLAQRGYHNGKLRTLYTREDGKMFYKKRVVSKSNKNKFHYRNVMIGGAKKFDLHKVLERKKTNYIKEVEEDARPWLVAAKEAHSDSINEIKHNFDKIVLPRIKKALTVVQTRIINQGNSIEDKIEYWEDFVESIDENQTGQYLHDLELLTNFSVKARKMLTVIQTDKTTINRLMKSNKQLKDEMDKLDPYDDSYYDMNDGSWYEYEYQLYRLQATIKSLMGLFKKYILTIEMTEDRDDYRERNSGYYDEYETTLKRLEDIIDKTNKRAPCPKCRRPYCKNNFQKVANIDKLANKECPICLQTCENPVQLKGCKHTGCKDCMKKWYNKCR